MSRTETLHVTPERGARTIATTIEHEIGPACGAIRSREVTWWNEVRSEGQWGAWRAFDLSRLVRVVYRRPSDPWSKERTENSGPIIGHRNAQQHIRDRQRKMPNRGGVYSIAPFIRGSL